MKSRALLILSAFCLTLPSTLDARTWKEAGSGRTLEGEYSKTEGDQVVIIRANGSSFKIPLAKLTEEDQKFVAAASAPKADPVAAADVFKWETDIDVAKKRAKDENKKILVDFTGSDWCGWCIKLKKEVFDKPEFQEYAKKNLVMLELDFPRKKELPAKEKEQNEKLSGEYQVEGFPTILLINSKGKELGRTGYQEGGPEKYVEHLKELLKGWCEEGGSCSRRRRGWSWFRGGWAVFGGDLEPFGDKNGKKFVDFCRLELSRALFLKFLVGWAKIGRARGNGGDRRNVFIFSGLGEIGESLGDGRKGQMPTNAMFLGICFVPEGGGATGRHENPRGKTDGIFGGNGYWPAVGNEGVRG